MAQKECHISCFFANLFIVFILLSFSSTKVSLIPKKEIISETSRDKKFLRNGNSTKCPLMEFMEIINDEHSSSKCL